MNIQYSKSTSFNQPIVALFFLTSFSVILIILRYMSTHNLTYFFLAWNLFLAWVPLIFIKIWELRLLQKPLKRWKSVIMFGLWLLFFPNAPYIITDLIHLNNRFYPSIWSDILMLFSCAFTGLIVGLYSLHIAHHTLLKFFNNFTAWLIISISILLSGFGIYLGRVQRWNSWDLFANPFDLFHDIIQQIQNPQAVKITFGFAMLLFIVHFTFNSLTRNEKS